MIYKRMAWLTCLGLCLAAPVRGGDSMREAIATLPADSVGVVCVPSLKTLDDHLQQTIAELGLQGMVPPPMNSVVGLIRTYMPMLQGIDENGTLAVVAMPVETINDLGKGLALVVPTADPKAMVQQLGGQQSEDGMWKINFFGQPQFAGTGEKRLIISESEDTARKVTESKGGLDKKLKPEVLKTLEGLDKGVWIDAERLLKLAKDQIDGMLNMMVAIQASQGAMGAQQAKATKEQIDMFVDGASSLAFGISLGKAGLALRGAFDAKAGTELHKNIKVKPTSESLLRGLPASNYMIAFGQTYDPAAMKAGIDNLDPYIEMLGSVEGMDNEKVGQLKNLAREWFPMCSAARGTIEPIGGGTGGLFGFAMILDTANSTKWIELAGKAVELAKSLVTGSETEKIPAEAKDAVKALTFATGAEEVGGVKVAHLKFDLSQIEELDEDDREQIGAILGKDGLLLRFGAVDDGQVAITFGGGAEYLGKLIESAKSKAAVLDSDPGITKVAPNLTRERGAVFYIAVDRIVQAIKSVQETIDEEPLPITMPKLDAPVALSSTGGDGWSRGDVFVPMELMVALKNAIMGMMGGGPPPAAPPGAGNAG